MAKIDLEKFICDFLTHKGGNIYDNIKCTLNDQGLEYTRDGEIVEIIEKVQKPDLDNTNGTNTIKFEKPKGELTEFESAIVNFAMYFAEDRQKPENEWQDEEVMIKNNVNYMLSLAYKQIAEEVDVDNMVESYKRKLNCYHYTEIDAYRQGILDTLEKIKGK